MKLTDVATSMIVQAPALSSMVLGAIGAFLGAGISGVSLAHVGAESLAAGDGVRWGTLVGGLALLVTDVALLVLLRGAEASPRLFQRAAAWTATAALGLPLAIGAGALVGATAGTGVYGQTAHVVAALPSAWPVFAASLLLAGAFAAMSTQASAE